MIDVKLKAPELKGITGWMNSKPLTSESLKGKAVLIFFWTYACINCKRMLPYLKKWHSRYSRKGLVIIGVHSPEFGFEKEPANVKDAVKELEIRFPVALDADKRTWGSFDNQCWPALYLIDQEGYMADVRFGEGGYEETESIIQRLLGLSKELVHEKEPGHMFDQSPDMYAGFENNPGLGSGLRKDRSGHEVYIDPGVYEPDVIYPEGRWEQEREYLELKEASGRLTYRFFAREACLVMEPVGKKAIATIFIDGKKNSSMSITKPGLYPVFRHRKYGERELVVKFKGKIRVYEFVFG